MSRWRRPRPPLDQVVTPDSPERGSDAVLTGALAQAHRCQYVEAFDVILASPIHPSGGSR